MKQKILIDLGKIKDLYSGLGQVSLNFGNRLYEINDQQYDLIFLLPQGFQSLFHPSIGFEFLSLKRKYFPQFCKKYDLWHAIHQDSPYFPSNNQTPYILTIHDLNFLDEKSSDKAQKQLRVLQKKINRANAITTISRYTENIVRKHLKIPDVPFQVIYNGVDIQENALQKPAFAPEGDFIFAMGMIKKKKNFGVLLDFMKLMPDYTLILAGNKSFEYARIIENQILTEGLTERIIMPGIVKEEEKFWLYKHCKAFIFPSKFEGFGLPVIEAMKFGKPVFLSTYSSLPEIGGEKAFYFENFESGYMRDFFKEKMNLFYTKAQNAADVKEYAQKFSWQKNVEAYLKLYRQILPKP